MDGQYQFILASHSPRRKNLLKLLGFHFRVVPSGFENGGKKTGSAHILVERNSLAKAKAVADRYPETWVLGADTVVAHGRGILGKPDDDEEALEMLLLLSGRTHSVYTGVSLVNKRIEYARTFHTASKVTFQKFSREEAFAYVRTREPADKAGAYGAQGVGSALIERIEGSYTNVVGLPLTQTVEMLKDAGIIETSTIRGKMYRLKSSP